MKPPQSYSFRSIYSKVRTKITQSYSFHSIYPRVCTKITPYDTHQPTLMSPRCSNITASIHDLIIRCASNNLRFIILNPTQRTSKSAPRFLLEKQRQDVHQPLCIEYPNVTSGIRELIMQYASNNFRFVILNPTQRTSKSAPRFLPEKQRRERASTPMHRLPQCHLGSPRVVCQHTCQVNQYDTPLSPRVFIARHTSSALKSIKVFNPITTKSQRENSIHQNKIERENTISSYYINKARDTLRS